jgi:hypothetical protein
MIKYSSILPFSIIFGLSLDLFSIVLFTYHMIIGQLPFLYGLFYILICLILVDMIITRYAGKIIITDTLIQVKYFFPWYDNIQIELSDIKKVETDKPSKKFYSKIFLTLNDDSNKEIDIQSWYNSIDGIRKVEVIINELIIDKKRKK